ncbi:nuclear transport factor 2 family protein [Lysinibacillus telephonicus]|uniref:nuclear transport factor 2 family protein n=1 Tax=Lysinibacillus telephonicus TaxID=1714840 RepID=UPI00397D6041
MKKWLMLAVALLMLTACNNKEESNIESSVASNKETTVGYEMLGDSIEEADDVPKDAEKEILAAFDEYIASFNSKDIDRYINTLSKNPQGFDVNEDIEVAKNVFAQYDINRTASDVTIVKYNEEEAQVYANLDVKMTEIKTNTELNSSGRQVTVFVKEDNNWKVTSVYYIGNESQQ